MRTQGDVGWYHVVRLSAVERARNARGSKAHFRLVRADSDSAGGARCNRRVGEGPCKADTLGVGAPLNRRQALALEHTRRQPWPTSSCAQGRQCKARLNRTRAGRSRRGRGCTHCRASSCPGSTGTRRPRCLKTW
eukprot:3161893-Rhodomonas_salina.2